MLLEPDGPLPHFTDFECYKTPGTGDAVEFKKHRTHDTGPFLYRGGHGKLLPDHIRFEPVEPAAEPVVLAVLHDIEEWRGGDRELDCCIPDLGGAAGIPRQQHGFFPGTFKIFFISYG